MGRPGVLYLTIEVVKAWEVSLPKYSEALESQILIDGGPEALVFIFSLVSVYGNAILSGLSTSFIEKTESDMGNYKWNLNNLGSRNAQHNQIFLLWVT